MVKFIEILNGLYALFSNNFFYGFGCYTILFFIIRYFSKRKKFLNNFDASAIRLVIFSGIVYAIVLIFGQVLGDHHTNKELQELQNVHRVEDPIYFYIYFILPIYWILLSQLLRIKKLSQSLLFRLLYFVPILMLIQGVVSFILSNHKDYISSSWTSIPGSNFTIHIVGSIVIKTMVFILIATIFHYSQKAFHSKRTELVKP